MYYVPCKPYKAIASEKQLASLARISYIHSKPKKRDIRQGKPNEAYTQGKAKKPCKREKSLVKRLHDSKAIMAS